MQKQGKSVKRLGGETARRGGSVIVLVVIALVILATLGIGLLTVAYGVRHDAIRFKNETAAMLAAEAGYEKAIYEMGQQLDILSGLQQGATWTSGNLSFPDADCDYQIGLFTFVNYRPIYKVVSTGHSGVFNRTVDVHVIQAVSGWDMGMCRVPIGSTSTTEVYFKSGEDVNMPIHINNLKKEPERDIYISGSPRFLEEVAMGESRYYGSTDKYATVMGLFEDGIYFNQPDCLITNEAAIQTKVNRFRDSTAPAYRFDNLKKPQASTDVPSPRYPAVQLEFFVEDGVGKVHITNNCTVQATPAGTYDYSIVPKSGGTSYQKYNIYAYHFKPTNQPDLPAIPLTDTSDIYVRQKFGDVQSAPGGQIFVDGSVVIGSSDYTNMIVKGKITVVATGNIWIADNIVVDGPHNADGMPIVDTNPNAIGLIAQGVIKVVDPGLSPTSAPSVSGQTYQPIGITKSGYSGRFLPDPTVVEAAITVGGGGWGAENVGNRKESTPPGDDLYVRGTIVEAVRGVVGLFNSSTGEAIDGYAKHYYLDERLLLGILPGDMWLRGKYVPAPAGWHDYRASD